MKQTLSIAALTATLLLFGASHAFAEDTANIAASADVSVEAKGWGAVRQPLVEERQELQQERAGLLKAWREDKNELQAERRDIAKTMFRGRVELRWNMVGNGFMQVIDRLESRIAKMRAEGTVTADAEASLAAAQDALEDAQSKAQALAAMDESTLTREIVIEQTLSIRTSLDEAKSLLRDTVGILKELQDEKQTAS